MVLSPCAPPSKFPSFLDVPLDLGSLNYGWQNLGQDSVATLLEEAKRLWEEGIALALEETTEEEKRNENAVDALFLMFQALVKRATGSAE